MAAIEIQAFDVLMNIQTVVPFTLIGSMAIFGIMKLLSKRILKQYERNEACELWQEVVTSGYEVIPSTNAGGDITGKKQYKPTEKIIPLAEQRAKEICDKLSDGNTKNECTKKEMVHIGRK